MKHEKTFFLISLIIASAQAEAQLYFRYDQGYYNRQHYMLAKITIHNQSIIHNRAYQFGIMVCPPPSFANKNDYGCTSDGKSISPFYFRNGQRYVPSDVQPIPLADYVKRRLGINARIVKIEENFDSEGELGLSITAKIPRPY